MKKLLLFVIGGLIVGAAAQGQAPVVTGPVPEWQSAAGSKMEFEVASLRQKAPGSPYDPDDPGDVDLDSSDYFRYTGGLLKATGLLVNYIIFAYKVEDATQYPLIDAQLPKWAHKVQFSLEARAAGHPSKDQVRLMVQSMLAERFKLLVHRESRQLPIYGLVLDRPGVMGLGLKAHPEDSLCTKMPEKVEKRVAGSAPLPFCGVMLWRNSGQMHMRMMAYTMEQIAGNLATNGASLGGMDLRPVVDRTGLSGRFDLDLEFVRVTNAATTLNGEIAPEEPGATFEQALKRQGGLKLVKMTGPVDVYVVDHVEMPSEN